MAARRPTARKRPAAPAGALANHAVETLRGPFDTEDKPIVEAIARNMGTQPFWDCKPLLLSIDGAATLARRILAKKMSLP